MEPTCLICGDFHPHDTPICDECNNRFSYKYIPSWKAGLWEDVQSNWHVIRKMDTDYIKNCILYLNRRPTHGDDRDIDVTRKIEEFQAEYNKRINACRISVNSTYGAMGSGLTSALVSINTDGILVSCGVDKGASQGDHTMFVSGRTASVPTSKDSKFALIDEHFSKMRDDAYQMHLEAQRVYLLKSHCGKAAVSYAAVVKKSNKEFEGYCPVRAGVVTTDMFSAQERKGWKKLEDAFNDVVERINKRRNECINLVGQADNFAERHEIMVRYGVIDLSFDAIDLAKELGCKNDTASEDTNSESES